MAILFNDFMGKPEADAAHLRAFIEAWFGPEDIVLLTAIAVDGQSPRSLSMSVVAKHLSTSSTESLMDLGRYEGREYGLYYGVNPLKEDHNVQLRSRGGKKDVREIYGVAIDLDVKPGSFENKEACYDFLNKLPLKASLIVDNGGSGGLHAYWRLADGEKADEKLLVSWWALMQEEAEGISIDRLIDSSRLMRLPGSVYYPKPGGKYGSVRLAGGEGARYTLQELLKVSEDAYGRAKERTTATKFKLMSDREHAASLAVESAGLKGTSWSQKIALSKLETRATEMDWCDILEPLGWALLKTADDGTRHWARPGQAGKSAHTDWEGSEVMSLHSWSTDTGLADLKEAGIPLTKYQVLLRLKYGDDIAKMVFDLI